MRVGINLLYLIPGEVGGTQTYAEELLGELVRQLPDVEFVIFVNRESRDLPLPSAPNVTVVVCPVDATSRLRRYLFEQVRLRSMVRARGVDLLHSLGYVGPLFPGCKHVVTIHDLIYVGFADYLSTGKRTVLRLMVRAVARRCDRVITVSGASKAQIVEDIGLPPAKVEVIHEAPRSFPERPSEGESLDELASIAIRPPYVVALSSLSPSKNIPRLIEAFATVADPGVQLVLLGNRPTGGQIERAVDASGVRDRIVLTGFVSTPRLRAVMANALVFAFPSTFEGFGLPVLDAQLLGVPVVSSSAASLPEVGGDGALYFDPTSVADIADVLGRVLDDAGLRSELAERGRDNAKRFSWEAAADATGQIYRAVCSERKGPTDG